MAKANSEVTDELAVMKRFSTTLARMSPAARRRVVAWLAGQIEEMAAGDARVPANQVSLFGANEAS